MGKIIRLIKLAFASLSKDIKLAAIEVTTSSPFHFEKTTFSVAVLDVNLGNEQSLPVAIRLAELGVPFILSTGYGERDDIRANYPPCPILRKPFSSETMAEAVFEAIRSNR